MRENVVKLVGVGRSFDSKPIFRGINLEVSKGDAVAIQGPSGMGKTTLLRIIGTLDRPTEGDVYVCGEDVLRLSKSKMAELRWSSIGFSFQEPILLPGLSSLDNILLPCIPRSSSAEMGRFRLKALDLLKELGLEDRVDYKPHQLSVGQKKRVDLARSLINDPELLIVDEPTTNLDRDSSIIIVSIIKRFLDGRGTVFLTTHQDRQLLDLSKVKIEIQDYHN
jgi:ABC-type lipoprotein export system ATPase subunit